jgi:thymidylate synthase
MEQFEKDYNYLIQKVLMTGERRETRNQETVSVFGTSIEFDLRKGFPLLSGRKMFPNGVLGELAALLRKPKCVDDFKLWGCNYWGQWADESGQLNLDYGNAWFDFEGFDQIADLKDKLKNDPSNRRMIVNAWRPHELSELSLPCCHYSYQFHVSTDNVISMVWTQRSVDTMVGMPSDFILAAAWLIAIAAEFNFLPGRVKMDFGDTHIYTDHIDGAHQYLMQCTDVVLARVTWSYATRGEDFCEFEPNKIRLGHYSPQPAIKFKLHG